MTASRSSAGSSPSRPGTSEIPIAETIDDITPAWLTDVLRTTGRLDGSVASVDATRVGTGQMGSVIRLTVGYAQGAAAAHTDDARPQTLPRTLIVKLASTDEQSRGTGLATRSYEVEVAFYNEIVDSVSIRTPRCFFADVDTTTGWFTVLLEDVTGAVQGDQIAGCSIDEAAVALEQLAALHAPRWNDPRLADYEWLNREQGPGIAAVLAGLTPAFVERYRDDLTDAEHALCTSSLDPVSRYLNERTGPRSLRHGDYRLDNMLFDPALGAREGRERNRVHPKVTVVDWQTVSHAEPVADASYFIAGSMSVEERRTHEWDLLRWYHQALTAMGVADYSWDACRRDYRRHTYHGLIMVVVPSMIVERTPRGDEMFLTTLRRYLAQIDDLETAQLIGDT